MPIPPHPAALAFALLVGLGAPAAAADSAIAPCAAADLLGGARRVAVDGASGRPESVTDGEVASEGARWDLDLALRLESPGGMLLYDLGTSRTLRSALIQADADDAYLLEGSLDGRAFRALGEAPALTGLQGLRTRAVTLPGEPSRYVRITPRRGDGRASISELQLFCVTPDAWQPRLSVVPGSEGEPEAATRVLWNDVSSRWWELALALAALGLLLAEWRASRLEGEARRQRERRLQPLFASAFAIAILTYFNFGAFHFGNFLHNWDTFHYYVGAKYFPELRYDGLYACVAIADAADPRWTARVPGRKIRDLERNVLVPAVRVLAEPESCTSRFSPARWRAFERDVAWFRAREGRDRWEEMSADHGFNATPVWMIAGSLLANLAPASDRSVGALALLDPLYFLGMAAILLWGFGLRASTVALLVLATSFPSRFYWTGGAYLRWDWLFFTVAAVALLRKGHSAAAGGALAYAALLRIFPGVLALGPALAVAIELGAVARSAASGTRIAALRSAVRGGPLRSPLRFFAGMTVAAALLVLASFAVAGGPSAWIEFAANTAKHKNTPLTNNMGLATVLTWRADEIGRKLHSDSALEPWARWKQARLAARERTAPVQAALALGALAILAIAVRRWRSPWISLALAALWIPFVIEMTSYYFAFLVVPALLWRERRAVGVLLLSLSAIGQFVSLAPFSFLPTWRDEQYTLISLATVLALAGVLGIFARQRSRGAVPEPLSGCPTSR